MSKQNSFFKKFTSFIALSIICHILVFATLIWIESNKPKKQEMIEVTFVEPAAAPEVKPLVEKVKAKNPTRVVETNNSNEELSEKAKYLAEKNNKVEKQTKAKFAQKFVNIEASKNQQVYTGKAVSKKPALFEKSFDAFAAIEKQNLKEQTRALAQNGQTGASSTNDSLDDAHESLITKLNTREFKYATYYNRIKGQLNSWWVPKVQQKFAQLMRKGRTIASDDKKITQLIIVLNNEGRLINVKLLAASGVRDLDDAAIEAFRSAAPFPNPPKGMIENDGTVQIRWDCVVES